jgi:hypothetical protein
MRAVAVPERMRTFMSGLAAMSQLTSTGATVMPPHGFSGSGAIRVQMTNPSGAGSPDATPSENGSARNWPCAGPVLSGMPTRPAPSAALNRVRRSSSRGGDIRQPPPLRD